MVLQKLTDLKVPPFLFDLAVHVATVISIVTVYRKDFMYSIKNFSLTQKTFTTYFLALLPTAVIGLSLKPVWHLIYENTYWVGGLFFFTGLVLLLTKGKVSSQKETHFNFLSVDISYMQALFIGVAQGVAVLPGISRSGLTIAIALLLGVKSKQAAAFSFFISIPAILGASLYEAFGANLSSLSVSGLLMIASGALAAYIFGVLSLRVLLKLLDKGKLYLFAPYLFLAGAFTILYFIG